MHASDSNIPANCDQEVDHHLLKYRLSSTTMLKSKKKLGIKLHNFTAVLLKFVDGIILLCSGF